MNIEFQIEMSKKVKESIEIAVSPSLNVEKEQEKCTTAVFKRMNQVLGSIKFQIFITVLTFYSLFADDIRTAAFGPSADFTFDVINLVLMSIFGLEIILSSLFIENYFLSFFFFLDVLSTASFIFDVQLITNSLFGQGDQASSNLSQLANQSKTSRAAARAVRIIKLFRIVRIIKIYKAAKKTADVKENLKNKQIAQEKLLRKKKNHHQAQLYVNQNQDQQHNQKIGLNQRRESNSDKAQKIQQDLQIITLEKKIELSKDDLSFQKLLEEKKRLETNQQQITEQSLQQMMKKESKIGKILSDLTVKKIVMVVLLIMLIVPLFNVDNYATTVNSWDSTTTNIVALLQKPFISVSTLNNLINYTISNFLTSYIPIISFDTPFNQLPFFYDKSIESLRNTDLITSSATISIADYNLIISANPTLTLKNTWSKQDLQIIVILSQKALNTYQALFSICKTFFVCFVLLLLLHIFSKDIDTLIVEPIQSMMQKLMNMAKDPESASMEELNADSELQTAIISNAIIKIGTLLSIVFGSAGAQIIGRNIIDEGDMNPLIEGKKKCAIFGFCDIRHFTQVTQVLQQEILIFVNKIGSIVHESVYRYGGSANKNIGQAFLLVWTIPTDKYSLNHQTNEIKYLDLPYLSVLADFAVFGFVKTLVKINKDPLVLQYREDPKLNAAIKDFSVDMGFGLHIGWAIEGAIGSEFKIDASYLSPNVNMASRLEAATKQFGVDFLLSQDLYEILTPKMKKYCRNIDRVTVKGSAKPIKLYTVDMNYSNISPPMNKNMKYASLLDRPDNIAKRALNMEYLKEKELCNYDADVFIFNKKQMREVLVNALSSEFKERFQLGVQAYLKGRWSDAHLHLCEALKYHRNDGPTKCLLNFMKKANYVAPKNWEHYRSLTSK